MVGKIYCSRHKKYETQSPKVKKAAVPVVNNTNAESTKIIIRRNKELKTFWHPETSLVFSDDKVVVGRVKDNTIVSLTEKDIDICKKWCFPFDKDFKTEEHEVKSKPKENEIKSKPKENENIKVINNHDAKVINNTIDNTVSGGTDDIEEILGVLQHSNSDTEEEELIEEEEDEEEEELIEEEYSDDDY